MKDLRLLVLEMLKSLCLSKIKKHSCTCIFYKEKSKGERDYLYAMHVVVFKLANGVVNGLLSTRGNEFFKYKLSKFCKKREFDVASKILKRCIGAFIIIFLKSEDPPAFFC